MNLHNWIETNIQYGRKLALLGVEGAGTGGQDLLHGQSLTLFLSESLGVALKHATTGACVGILGACLSRRHRSARRALAYGALGGAAGFGAGLTWRTHRLAASMGRGALQKMSSAREERWLDRHPIDYA
jgi:hypothetical protein